MSEKIPDNNATESWLQFYRSHDNQSANISPFSKLNSYNKSFFELVSKEIYLRREHNEKVRIWSAGSGIDPVSLKLKEIYKDDIELTIFDVSRECIRENKIAFERHHLSANFVIDDLFNSNYLNEFDIVMNTGLLEHFSNDQQKSLMEIFSKSLRSSGIYVTYVPYSRGKLYVHCMERMKKKGTWELGREIPITTFKEMRINELMLVEEYSLDALYQLSFIRPAHPFLGSIVYPMILFLMNFPSIFEPIFLKIINGYGLFALFKRID